MKHYLIDTNVVIDMLVDREGAADACFIIDGAELGEYQLHLCSLSVTNIYYSLRKQLTREERVEALKQLCKVLKVIPVDDMVIQNALNSGWKDLEDAVQYCSAKAIGYIDGIITRNEKDFVRSDIEVIHSSRFIRH